VIATLPPKEAAVRRFSALVLSALLGIAAVAADNANIVKNASLEDPIGENGLPDGWFAFQQPANSYKFSVVEGGKTGKALQIEGAGEYGGVGIAKVPIEAGKQYAARGWVKLDATGDTICIVKLDYFGANGEYLTSSYFDGNVRAGTKDWQRISVISRKADALNATSVGIAVAMNGKGKALFDDLELISRPAPPTPNLMRNGSFEDVAGPAPYGCSIFTSDGGKVTLQWSEREPKDGWYSLRMVGNAEWAVATEGRVAVEAGKTYVLTGVARARKGLAHLKIDYFKDDEWIGQSVTDNTTEDAWKEMSVTSDLAAHPGATHIGGAVAGLGDMDVQFDSLRLVSK
jgi:hypothetical protein